MKRPQAPIRHPDAMVPAALGVALALAIAASGCSGLRPSAEASRDQVSEFETLRRPSFEPMLLIALPDLTRGGDGASTQVPARRLEALVAQDTPITEILLTLFRDSDVNLMVDPSITATATATFDVKNTTVEEAFEAVLRNADLAYEWDGSFLHVRTMDRRLFDVDIPNAAALGGNQNAGGQGGGQGGGAGGGGAAGVQADPWARLEQDLAQLAGENGVVLVNPIAGTVAIEARPSAIARVHNYLDQTVRRVTAQVSLEARVLEVQLDDEYRLGVNWSILPGFLNTSELGTLTNGAVFSQAAASGGTAFNFGLLDAGNFEIFVDALERQGEVRVLSSPRIATLNNMPANIRVVQQIPIIDREVIDSLGGNRTEFDIRFTDAGVTLSVTPQIGTDGTVTCQISPRITERVGEITTPDGLQTEPILAIRETSTSVRVPDGETIVVGGLRSTQKSETLQGIPLLSSIPWLGALFRSTVQTRVELELMVLLVPRIIDDTWRDEELRRGLHRLVTLRKSFQPSTLGLDSFRDEDYETGLLQGEARGVTSPSVDTELPVARSDRRDSSALTISKHGLADRFAQRAATELERGHESQALALIEQAMELDRTRVDLLIAAALIESNRNDHSAALRYATRACSGAPDEPLARLAAGIVAVNAGNPDAAIRHLRAADSDASSALTACNLGAAWILVEDFEAARDALAPYADAVDAPPELHANLAFVNLRLGDIDAARSSYQAALSSGAPKENARIRALAAEILEVESAVATPGPR